MNTEERLARALDEQNRLLKRSDRRGGCLWNLIMLLLFGLFYVAWLVVKRIVLLVLAVVRLAWRALAWTAAVTWAALRWAGTQIAKPFRKGRTDAAD